MDNIKILGQLKDKLRYIEQNMKQAEKAVCEKKLARLYQVLDEAAYQTNVNPAVVVDTVKHQIEDTIQDIANEEHELNTELHGVEGFTFSRYYRMNAYPYLSHELVNMLKTLTDEKGTRH